VFDPHAACAEIRARGYTLIPEFLDAGRLARVRAVLDRELGAHRGRNNFEGHATERVYTLVARDAVFQEVIEDPRALALCDALLDPNYLLTGSLAICIHPGESPQPWHVDDAFYPLPRPRPMVSFSTIVAVDDFTAENGGTEVIPGSHLWSEAEIGGDYRSGDHETDPEFAARMAGRGIAVELPAGGCLAFAGNLATLFLAYEALTLVTYPLVTHHGDDEARRGGRVYLGYLIGTSIVFLLPAVIWTWLAAGSLDFRVGGLLAGKLDGATAPVLLALYMFGIGKAALMPFHRWLPAAMVAPTPVSALLHAVAVVKAGVFAVLKVVVYVFGIDTLAALGGAAWLTAIAAFTVVCCGSSRSSGLASSYVTISSGSSVGWESLSNRVSSGVVSQGLRSSMSRPDSIPSSQP